MAQGPVHDLSEFLKACRKGSAFVHVPGGAAKQAYADYELQGPALLKYVGKLDVSKLRYHLTEKTHRTAVPPPALHDAYKYQMRSSVAYLAFLRYPNGVWELKSFHKDVATHFSDVKIGDDATHMSSIGALLQDKSGRQGE